MTSKTSDLVIAFIGLGVMGAPIARRMRAQFAHVIGFDLSPVARADAASHGIVAAESVAEAVREAQCVFMMLPKVEIARQVTQEVVVNARRGSILVELGTIGSDAAREHAGLAIQAGHRYVDAPVINGGQQGAQDGTLKILAGGELADVEAVTPALRTFSTETFHMGPVGTGQSMKLVHNTLLAALTTAYAEALVLADKSGIGAARALEILKVASTRSFALDWLFSPAVRGDFGGGAKVDILVKDLLLGQREVERFEAPASMAARATSLYQTCQAQGMGQLDMSAIFKLLSEQPRV
ncbi:MAG: NAD(P)-dependent oxidoreductase [Burkholderiaceae bacterium]|nr:NAD(P)-dependent oxidoreductase [Burkholderiaceae bacterium]